MVYSIITVKEREKKMNLIINAIFGMIAFYLVFIIVGLVYVSVSWVGEKLKNLYIRKFS